MDIDLQQFCADPEWNAGARLDMTKPWIDGRWRYATDARILVRIPADEARKPDTVPDAASIFHDFDPTPCTHQLPSWDGSIYEYEDPCDYPQCHGGKISGGKRSCKVCDGKGWTPESMDTTVEFQDFNFGGGYMRKIRVLPGVKGYVKPWEVGGQKHGQLQFVFDNGGQGVLMNISNTITTKGIDDDRHRSK